MSTVEESIEVEWACDPKRKRDAVGRGAGIPLVDQPELLMRLLAVSDTELVDSLLRTLGPSSESQTCDDPRISPGAV